jgi:hypothetical protein
MNSGIYGMTSGQSLAGRKVAASAVGRVYDAITSVVSVIGANPQSVALTAATRTRLVAISGRGAVRAAALQQSLGSVNLRLELWIDGVRVSDSGTVTTVSGTGIVIAGGGVSGQTPLWDWIPFENSMEFWATSANTGSHTYGLIYDIHQ